MRDLSPTFMWLLRDFQFQLTEEGRQVGRGLAVGCLGCVGKQAVLRVRTDR